MVRFQLPPIQIQPSMTSSGASFCPDSMLFINASPDNPICQPQSKGRYGDCVFPLTHASRKQLSNLTRLRIETVDIPVNRYFFSSSTSFRFVWGGTFIPPHTRLHLKETPGSSGSSPIVHEMTLPPSLCYIPTNAMWYKTALYYVIALPAAASLRVNSTVWIYNIPSKSEDSAIQCSLKSWNVAAVGDWSTITRFDSTSPLGMTCFLYQGIEELSSGSRSPTIDSEYCDSRVEEKDEQEEEDEFHCVSSASLSPSFVKNKMRSPSMNHHSEGVELKDLWIGTLPPQSVDDLTDLCAERTQDQKSSGRPFPAIHWEEEMGQKPSLKLSIHHSRGKTESSFQLTLEGPYWASILAPLYDPPGLAKDALKMGPPVSSHDIFGQSPLFDYSKWNCSCVDCASPATQYCSPCDKYYCGAQCFSIQHKVTHRMPMPTAAHEPIQLPMTSTLTHIRQRFHRGNDLEPETPRPIVIEFKSATHANPAYQILSPTHSNSPSLSSPKRVSKTATTFVPRCVT